MAGSPAVWTPSITNFCIKVRAAGHSIDLIAFMPGLFCIDRLSICFPLCSFATNSEGKEREGHDGHDHLNLPVPHKGTGRTFKWASGIAELP